MTRNIVDAGPLIGCFNSDDQWHEWSVAALSALPHASVSEAVLTETAYHLRKSRAAVSSLLSWIRNGALQVVPVVAENIDSIDELLAKYPEMDLCDATVVRLSEIFRDSRVITTDRKHFKIYRRHRNQPIPLICPP